MKDENDEEKLLSKRKKIRTSSVRVPCFVTVTTKDVKILQRMFGNISRFPKTQSHTIENHPVDAGFNRLPICKKSGMLATMYYNSTFASSSSCTLPNRKKRQPIFSQDWN